MKDTTAEQITEQPTNLIPEPSHGSSRLKRDISDRLDEGIRAVRHASKHAKYLGEDLLDETAHSVKKHPFRAIGTGFALGVATGIVIGLTFKRK